MIYSKFIKLKNKTNKTWGPLELQEGVSGSSMDTQKAP